jgi:non-specific protein-tyrosine kinase
VTLRSYLRVLRERWKLVVAFTVLATLVAVVITALTPKSYTATAQDLVASSGSTDPLTQAQAAAYVATQVSTFASVVNSQDVVNFIRTDMNLPKSQISDSALKGKLSASVPTGKSIIEIHATDGHADQAARIANSAAKGLAKSVEGYTTTPNGASVHLFQTGFATAPGSPTSPNKLLNIALGVLLGLLVGAALAVARDILDTRIKDADTLAKVANSPTMGVVVEDPKTQRHPIATRAGTRNMRAENYRQLRANLQFANVDEHPRVIAVTSSIPGEGKTTVAINLASTLAEAGFTVCLVDSDLRRPTIAKVLGLLSPVGLTSVLIHQIELSEAMQSAGSNFYVLTSGPTPPNPSEVLASSYVRDIVRSLLDKVDYVVLDTAPLLPVADGSEVAALADGTLLVARHGVSTDSHIRRAVHALARVDAKLLGVVLNRIPARKSSEYGYTYYRAENEVSAHASQPARAGRGRRGK